MNPITESLQYTYEHSKLNWIMLSLAYAITPCTILWMAGKLAVTHEFHWSYLINIVVAFCFTVVIASWLMSMTKKELEQKLRCEHPCPYCHGKGWKRDYDIRHRQPKHQ